MKPGRELDALIAEKVMGLDPRMDIKWQFGISGRPETYREETTSCKNPKPYSTDIAAAWEVVEKLLPEHGFSLHSSTSRGFGWMVKMDKGAIEEIAHTLPHAICLAALKAVGS